ncbi:MAG: molybdenum ABC transporter ATP-binding protein [Planctomycetaceae bacterium]|nr:molybdenum ABC transporter ATP-binding protein [Planctomycetaceae bacterium]
MSHLEFACQHSRSAEFRLDARFETHHGVTALFGPSGAGKTTVLAIIAGLLKPDAGSVVHDGRVLVRTTERRFLPPEKRRIGMVFQDHLLFPHLTVRKNLSYSRRAAASGRKLAALGEVAAALDIEKLLEQFPRQLSGGERQRVALGRALLSQPDLLLLDEPLSSLDARLRYRILDYVERVVRLWDVPVVFVSHSQAEVRRLAQWVVMLDRGRVVQVGTPEEVLGSSDALALQNSAAPINLLRFEKVRRAGDHCFGQLGSQEVFVPLQGPTVREPLIVQFSPRDVILGRHGLTGVSARNQLSGTIRQIVRTDYGVFAAVDVGQIVWAAVTEDAIRELDLQIGGEAICLVKAHSLEVLG